MNLSHRGFIIILLTAIALGVVGYQQKSTMEKAEVKEDKSIEKNAMIKFIENKHLDDAAEATGGYRNDNTITDKVKTEILSSPLLDVSQIYVNTTNGVVSLSGVVESAQSVDRASEIARNVKHVRSVKNDLVVKTPQ